MQMEFLKLDKERESPPEELQSTQPPVCLSVLACPIYPHTHTPHHTPPSTLTDIVDFTDEEGYGKYLDLHQCYDCYINLKLLEVGWIRMCVSMCCM